MKKRTAYMWLLLLIITGFCGCGKKSVGNGEPVIASKDYIYKVEDMDIFSEDQGIDQIMRCGNQIYMYGYSWDEETEGTILSIFQLDHDGTLGEVYQLPGENNIGRSHIHIDKEGYLYCIETVYPESEEEIDPDTGELIEVEEVEDVERRYLVKMSLQGEKIYSVCLNDIPEFQKLYEDNGFFYVNNMIVDDEKAIYLRTLGNLVQFDMEGNLVKMVDSEQNELRDASIIILDDDLDKGTIGEKYKLPGLSYEYNFFPGVGYDLYLSNSIGIYGYNLGDSDKTLLMNYIDSDLETYGINNLVAISEREFFGFYDGASVPVRFTKVDPKDVKDKQQITLATVYTNWTIRQEVINFNKTNEDYRISILDYNALYGSDNDYMAGISKLNNDLVSGKVPDILIVNMSMPVESYINKGLFEDLKPYIKEDEELDLNDLMPNIIEAFSANGKLYSLVPSYYIHTLATRVSDVGDKEGWTVQEAVEILDSKPSGTQFINDVTRNDMLEYCMDMSGSQFVDWDRGVCHFDSDEFIQMLEFIKRFPKEIDYDKRDDAYWMNYDAMWREGKVLTSVVSVTDFRDYNYLTKVTYGEDITLIGFPTASGDGATINPSLQLAMSAKSENKEGVWEFLRNFLLDEYQESCSDYSLPISVKRFNEMGEEAMQRPYYMDENNNKVEYDETYYIGEIEVEVTPMTEQEVERFKENIYSFTDVYRSDENLINIINEETAPYFADQKSAKDVAAIIQSRVQIYVNENR